MSSARDARPVLVIGPPKLPKCQGCGTATPRRAEIRGKWVPWCGRCAAASDGATSTTQGTQK